MARDFDIAILGATGSVGKVMAAYYAERAPATLRWAICGRPKSEASLRKVHADLMSTKPKSTPQQAFADVTDMASLRRIAARSSVLLTSVGPYSSFGEAVVVACIEEGTHYVDITGEIWWVAEMRAKYGARAQEMGVCLVSLAGYDCVPFEMSALLCHKHLKNSAGGSRLASVECLTKVDGGGLPPGTMLTLLSVVTLGVGRALLGFARFLPRSERLGTLRDLGLWALPQWSYQHGGFTVLEGMGAVSCAVVHSGAPALGYPNVSFNSRMDLPLGGGLTPWALCTLWGTLPIALVYALTALSAPLMFAGFSILMLVPAASRLLGELIPRLGYAGRQDVQLLVRARGVGADGSIVRTSMAFAGDPGIYATAQCACETAWAMVDTLCAGSSTALALPAGFMTPGPAVGDALLKRLAQAGVRIEAK